MVKKIRKVLLLWFMVPIIICLAMVVLYENNVVRSCMDVTDVRLEALLVGIMEIVTICIIPLSLRFFKFGFVKRAFAVSPEQALTRWGVCRILMLAIPMIVNTFLYYQYINVSFGYMGIIGLLSMMFIFPTTEKCEQDLKPKG